ncbi:hypothetical protein BpHYR1_041371 [Brachionus plicatilis]|uniref:Uncharacterized protein n=1 Tax=Brachionus plicatilis TaxID=10195 RepID=A0A3M7SLQ1_BRAPC|nr:hypothetical protein BpHYR1_041371 [Brachionus plicatilis]
MQILCKVLFEKSLNLKNTWLLLNINKIVLNSLFQTFLRSILKILLQLILLRLMLNIKLSIVSNSFVELSIVSSSFDTIKNP